MLELILIRQEMGRPFALPDGVAAERVATLRAAFEATLKDPASSPMRRNCRLKSIR